MLTVRETNVQNVVYEMFEMAGVQERNGDFFR